MFGVHVAQSPSEELCCSIPVAKHLHWSVCHALERSCTTFDYIPFCVYELVSRFKDIVWNVLFTLFELINHFSRLLYVSPHWKNIKYLQLMLRSIITPLRGRICISAPPTSGPLRPCLISSMKVPLCSRRQFSVGKNNLPIENAVGRGPFSAANTLRKPLALRRPVQLASIFRWLSLSPELAILEIL